MLTEEQQLDEIAALAKVVASLVIDTPIDNNQKLIGVLLGALASLCTKMTKDEVFDIMAIVGNNVYANPPEINRKPRLTLVK